VVLEMLNVVAMASQGIHANGDREQDREALPQHSAMIADRVESRK
jgi:hypothetical protein